MYDRIAIGWEVSAVSGWGVFGMNLAKGLMTRDNAPTPVLLAEPNLIGLEPEDKRALVPLMVEARKLTLADAPVDLPGTLVLDSLRNGLEGSALAARVRGRDKAGVVFLENAALDAAALDRAKAYRHIFAGSTWNAEVLKAAGLEAVSPLLQGIDPNRFHPRPKTGTFAGRFVIFSGGKLEFRKGQDLVVAAFKHFQESHPDALLIAAWSNTWPDSIGAMEQAGHVPPLLKGTDGTPDLEAWLRACGLPEDSVIVPGLIPNARMPDVLADVDCALFPNRCEGGTNLVAMECMASGLPTILAANTGHLDLIAADRCIALARQTAYADPARAGWGDSDVDEIVAALEHLYDDRAAAARTGEHAATFLRNLTWDHTVATLMDAISCW